MGANWSLAQQGGDVFTQSLRMGMAMGEGARQGRNERNLRAALATVAADPENASALASVFVENPELGARLMDRADERSFARDAGTVALHRSALAGRGSPAAGTGIPALAPRRQEQAYANGATQPIVAGGPSDARSTVQAPSIAETAPTEPDLSFLGEPQSEGDAAFLRMIRRDPVKALKIDGALRDNFVGKLKSESEVYTLGIAELGRATDQQSWDDALDMVLPRAEAAGMDIFQAVPLQYPGADGVAALMKRAQPVKEQLDLLLREANVDADNARADRVVNSQIEARAATVAERERHNRAREGNQRRGQDITSRDRQSRPTRAKSIIEVATPAEAAKLPKGTKFRGPDGKVRVVP